MKSSYGRAGFGRSEHNPSQAPYDINQEVKALEMGLKALNVANKKMIIVAHSYGSFITFLFTAYHPEKVSGVILVDANLPELFIETRVNSIMSEVVGNKNSIEKNNPSFFKLLEAFPLTIDTMKKVKLPESIPIIDIVAENPPFKSKKDNTAWKHEHEKFTTYIPRPTVRFS